jgi:hypothetical protein
MRARLRDHRIDPHAHAPPRRRVRARQVDPSEILRQK